MPISTTGTTYTIDGTDDAGLDPIAIGGIVDATWGDGETTTSDVTTQASTVMEDLAGLPNSGSFTAELVADEDDVGQIEFRAAKAQGNRRTVVIVNSSGTLKTYTFDVIVLGFSAANPVNAHQTRSMTAKIVTPIVIS